MDIQNVIGKVPYKNKSYKVTVFRHVFMLVVVLFLAFIAYTYYDYRKECQINAQREAQVKAARIVNQNDERLENLRQYYITMSSNDSINWMLENNISYSDYSSYKAAYEDMESQGIFSDYLNSFTFMNFRTGWILSNKGLFPLYEVYNADTVMSVYEEKTKIEDKNYWSYDTDGVVLNSKVDREYRLTVETNGLNFIMRLPATSYNTYAVFIANIDMDTWKGWIAEWLEGYEQVVVLDKDGNLIYATDASLEGSCRTLFTQDKSDGQVRVEQTDYMVGRAKSDILGWNYYVFRDVDGGQAGMRLPIAIFALLLLLIIACFLLVSNLIYHPIDALLRDVAEGDGGASFKGNELEYLAGSYHDLRKDKQALEGLLYQQQDKLEELFELRLLHGEVDEEEWDEYLAGFKLRPWKYFATTVVILNLGDEEMQSMVNEDAICLKLLSEMPDALKNKAWMPPIYNASAIFAIFAEDDEDTLLAKIQDFYTKTREYAQQNCDYDILMGVSATHTNYRHMRAAYRESINALTFKTIAGNEADGEKGEPQNECHFYLASSTVLGKEYNRQFEEDIQAAVKAVDKKQCYQVTDAFCHYLNQAQGHEEELPLYLLRYVNMILITALDAGIQLKDIYPEGMKKTYRELLEVVEPDRERRYIKWKFIDPVIKVRMEYMESHSGSMLEEIEQLIEEKKGNLSLTECADILGVHQTYIWKVLKMERDKSFSDYVEEYKIKEAKRLLLESDMTVAEIAEQLNYTNAQNFIRFFSKSTGVTPGKFRKLY